ncbi:molybdate ABC transporter substrate-binding protein [Nostoc sp. 'Peltigera malacea cyanobiont' DB3992]|uniref:molybdate ABC transporter substrate-binding protein n=1 Tax=Nostoc sp. 'Peltigera malacea cyanobiont' DB3992 TaxID=1206980 RepID=UPI0015D518E0|nr:substrate-binding domain-containing protein [Nostoc sp. 'Peltigera malacea cyanobiont' DB3992]
MTDTLPQVEALYRQSNPNVTFINTFGASGTLANQILAGTNPVDIFFSVSQTPLNTLENAGKLIAGTRQNVLNNTLAIITPINSTISISSVQDLLQPQVRQVAIGDPTVFQQEYSPRNYLPIPGYRSKSNPNLSSDRVCVMY